MLLHEQFQPWAILGFVCLAFGTLLYNEIIVLKYFDFDQYTKIALAAKEGKDTRESEKLLKQDYMASSPHAAYDSNRNIRQLQKKMDGQDMTGDDFDMNDVNLNNRATVGLTDSSASQGFR